LISIAFVSLGIAIASRMRDQHGFQLIINFIVMPMFFLSGALFPLQNLPAWLQAISYANPMTYGVDGLRGSLIGVSHFSLMFDFAVLAAFSIAMIYISARLFRKTTI
jgi:ABC-2 type transport system permease protein